jgi:hypothetical protein
MKIALFAALLLCSLTAFAQKNKTYLQLGPAIHAFGTNRYPGAMLSFHRHLGYRFAAELSGFYGKNNFTGNKTEALTIQPGFLLRHHHFGSDFYGGIGVVWQQYRVYPTVAVEAKSLAVDSSKESLFGISLLAGGRLALSKHYSIDFHSGFVFTNSSSPQIGGPQIGSPFNGRNLDAFTGSILLCYAF